LNLFQAANGAATFLILSALVAGMAKHLESTKGSPDLDLLNHPNVICLGAFLVIFRIKIFLDDHRHFGEFVQDKNWYRYAGFALAVVSWFFWALAAYLLTSTERASELLATSIMILTAWIAIHVIEILRDPDPARGIREVATSLKRQDWVLFNVAYILCLVTHAGWFIPVIPPGQTWPLLLLFVPLALDMRTSDSFRDLIPPPARPT
jgi:hypothetical protein